MLHGNNPIIKLKVGLNLANKLNNVSHNTFCLYQELVEEGRVHALIEKTRCKATELQEQQSKPLWYMLLNNRHFANIEQAISCVNRAFLILAVTFCQFGCIMI